MSERFICAFAALIDGYVLARVNESALGTLKRLSITHMLEVGS